MTRRTSSSSMSTRAPSIANSAISIKMRNLALQGKPVIDISLKGDNGRHGSYVSSFSTMDTLEGEVAVTAPHDTRFDDIEISFIGTCRLEPCRDPQLTTNPYRRRKRDLCW